MKKIALFSTVFILMMIFGFGFTMNRAELFGSDEVEQVHLSCWDEEGTANFERIRLVLNKSLTGLAWFSTFSGVPTEEGTITPSFDLASEEKSSTLAVSVVTATHSFLFQIPQFAFQPHVRTIKMMVEKDDNSTALECRKINLARKSNR